ncbi:hypothetical protein JDV09_20730 [Mycobacterium sp. Y57]|uniref:hypothetical protein n=1 Tax=Mycolicibacterium xanthum TaxID=2796469 RepID=UPI001C848DE9|nr:hypothetical protein [Mycolicibacterium xanthum]MBX7434506.1 hypothetical protein [Mycolicibacterium xanthum]
MGYPYPGYPGYGHPPPARPQRSGADMAISITVLVFIVALGGIAAVMGLFSVAFIDHCPPATCSIEGAVTAVFTSLLVAGGIGVAGVVLTIVQLVRRRTAWPFAVATLALCLMTLFVGAVGYVAAVS